jgi:5-methylcytosine-specific restriction protein A
MPKKFIKEIPGLEIPRTESSPFTRDLEIAAFYNTTTWRKLSKRVKLEEPFCRVDGCNNPTEVTDHIVAIEDGGEKLLRENLQGLCHKHHNRKSAKERWKRSRNRK